jgi:hypothetical protein
MGMFRRNTNYNKLSVTTPLENAPLMDKGGDAIIESDGYPNEDGNNANSPTNKKKVGLVEKAGNILRSMRPGGDDYGGDVETIGDQLAVEDQFYLEVPIKKNHPTSTNTTTATGDKKRESLFSRMSPKSRTMTVDHAETSTVSSLTYNSGSHYQSRSSRSRSRRSSNHMGCCGSSIGSDDRRRRRSSSKHQEPSLFQWLFSCQGQEEDLTCKTEPICYRRSSRRHALFDDALEDDADDDNGKHTDAISVVEVGTTAAHDDSYTINTKTSGWRRFLPKARSIPRFRSFRRRSGVGGGKTVKATEADFVF